ncbi:unnamed protein product [Durusdinium trenchii]|uniref:Uncharacterized protein n=1 Tax=Durusdinium trenchii TaxID=1381693 RepID=A0ABP0RHG3_9DINO
MASRPASRCACVPAIFPFPEPIPHEVPRRSERKPQMKNGSGHSDDPGALKLRVQNPSFVAEQKRRANRWIQETAPTPVANNKRALWLVLKKDLEAKRQRYQAAFRRACPLTFGS